MLKTIISIIIMLHGLVHAWYILLLGKAVKFVPEMGWTGASWFIPGSPDNPAIRLTGIILYGLAGLLFVISAISLMMGSALSSTLLVISAILSSALILLFFDGRFEMWVQKGLLGLIFNLIILITTIYYR